MFHSPFTIQNCWKKGLGSVQLCTRPSPIGAKRSPSFCILVTFVHRGVTTFRSMQKLPMVRSIPSLLCNVHFAQHVKQPLLDCCGPFFVNWHVAAHNVQHYNASNARDTRKRNDELKF